MGVAWLLGGLVKGGREDEAEHNWLGTTMWIYLRVRGRVPGANVGARGRSECFFGSRNEESGDKTHVYYDLDNGKA